MIMVNDANQPTDIVKPNLGHRGYRVQIEVSWTALRAELTQFHILSYPIRLRVYKVSTNWFTGTIPGKHWLVVSSTC